MASDFLLEPFNLPPLVATLSTVHIREHPPRAKKNAAQAAPQQNITVVLD